MHIPQVKYWETCPLPIFSVITVFIRVLFFHRCLDLIVYIVPFTIVLYLSIQLQKLPVCLNKLTHLLTYFSLGLTADTDQLNQIPQKCCHSWLCQQDLQLCQIWCKSVFIGEDYGNRRNLTKNISLTDFNSNKNNWLTFNVQVISDISQ